MNSLPVKTFKITKNSHTKKKKNNLMYDMLCKYPKRGLVMANKMINKKRLTFCLVVAFFVYSCGQKNNPVNVVGRKSSLAHKSESSYKASKTASLPGIEVSRTADLGRPSDIHVDTGTDDGCGPRWVLEFNVERGDAIRATLVQNLDSFGLVEFNFERISDAIPTVTASIPVQYIRGGALRETQIGVVQNNNGEKHALFACFARAIDPRGFRTQGYELHLYLDGCNVRDGHIVKDDRYVGTIGNGQARTLWFWYSNSAFIGCTLEERLRFPS
jgi:hypothetical protein